MRAGTEIVPLAAEAIYHATMLGMRRALEGVLHVARAARIDRALDHERDVARDGRGHLVGIVIIPPFDFVFVAHVLS